MMTRIAPETGSDRIDAVTAGPVCCILTGHRLAVQVDVARCAAASVTVGAVAPAVFDYGDGLLLVAVPPVPQAVPLTITVPPGSSLIAHAHSGAIITAGHLTGTAVFGGALHLLCDETDLLIAATVSGEITAGTVRTGIAARSITADITADTVYGYTNVFSAAGVVTIRTVLGTPPNVPRRRAGAGPDASQPGTGVTGQIPSVPGTKPVSGEPPLPAAVTALVAAGGQQPDLAVPQVTGQVTDGTAPQTGPAGTVVRPAVPAGPPDDDAPPPAARPDLDPPSAARGEPARPEMPAAGTPAFPADPAPGAPETPATPTAPAADAEAPPASGTATPPGSGPVTPASGTGTPLAATSGPRSTGPASAPPATPASGTTGTPPAAATPMASPSPAVPAASAPAPPSSTAAAVPSSEPMGPAPQPARAPAAPGNQAATATPAVTTTPAVTARTADAARPGRLLTAPRAEARPAMTLMEAAAIHRETHPVHHEPDAEPERARATDGPAPWPVHIEPAHHTVAGTPGHRPAWPYTAPDGTSYAPARWPASGPANEPSAGPAAVPEWPWMEWEVTASPHHGLPGHPDTVPVAEPARGMDTVPEAAPDDEPDAGPSAGMGM